ncbi:hypothetical protein CHARACLAT_031065 [Characodon lateralis]|uniref:Uncharacterized protein n=1 Tax=Characodon lateralis TaxID=208331 RepID=A0ABU7D255_9TELE|nr:hypothetical protein [Characodon lateralis]
MKLIGIFRSGETVQTRSKLGKQSWPWTACLKGVCFLHSGCGIWCPTHNHLNKMTLRMRAWRKRKKDLGLLLRYSDGEDEHRDIENNCHSVPGSQSRSCRSSNVSETSHSFLSCTQGLFGRRVNKRRRVYFLTTGSTETRELLSGHTA